MEDKKNYTHKEMEEAILAYGDYIKNLTDYNNLPSYASRIGINLSVEECKKKFPKSLIDKLGIKKIE